MTYNTDYIQQKLAAIARAPRLQQPAVRLDAYWRIASEADLFSDLSHDGTLTQQQYAAVEQHLRKAGVTVDQ